MRGNRPLGLLSVCVLGTGVLIVAAWAQEASPPANVSPAEKRIAERVGRMTEGLNLTEDQQQKVKAILQDKSRRLEELREQLRGLEREMNEAIDAVLTEEQMAKNIRPPLDAREREPGEFGRGVPGTRFAGPGPMARLRGLDLAEEQRDKIREILRSRPENPREAVAQVLTDEQKERLKAYQPPFFQWGRPPRGERGRFGGPEWAPPFRRGFQPGAERKTELRERFRGQRDERREALRERQRPERKERLRSHDRSQREWRDGPWAGRRGGDRDRDRRGGERQGRRTGQGWW